MANSGDHVQGRLEKDSEPTGQSTAARSENITEVDAYCGGYSSLDPAEEYSTSRKRRGVALIFNQERFFWKLTMPDRHGTNADKYNLTKRLEDLDFEVKAHDNLNKAEVFAAITEVAEDDHVDADCFICVFLSHGENEQIYAHDDKFNIQDVTRFVQGGQMQEPGGKAQNLHFSGVPR
ncbi:hypothetical protein SKAU_G00037910 [Synaphobranchus kaupii]|uniref:Caspase family p20 domain-containing protein n=1 Tax=Synaphobranchus kaupii TaxID=118154 RepID=A0A9Q1GGK6_SYNKA|nr:hypothetical protein SKAU_G00037910 [Synaphobranchus kaupii]